MLPHDRLSSYGSFGPDPYLNGEGAFETIVGVQSVGVQACAKHLIGNNQEHWRYGLTANIDDRTLHEIYFYPFLRSLEVNLSNITCFETYIVSDYRQMFRL
jgi:beta-glucosidase